MRITKLLIIMMAIIMSNVMVINGQTSSGPVNIKVNRIVLNPGNQYAIYIPTFEFHVLFRDDFKYLRSAISADYDYRRQDMGFGMSHATYKYIINPGITVEDNIMFREIFSDSTGIWNRKQAIIPFIYHELNEYATVGMEFKFERDRSPKRRLESEVINSKDRSINIYYLYKDVKEVRWDYKMYYLSLERSYRFFEGDFNYLVFQTYMKRSFEINKYLRYLGVLNLKANLTPQDSPLFFLGGHSTLIGYNNDQYWGRKAYSSQNLFEIKPFPTYEMSIFKTKFRRIGLLFQVDFGKVSNTSRYSGMKAQPKDVKVGLGFGIGVNTDLPRMPATDVHFIIASPSNDMDLKFYAGFGGWIN